MSSFFIILVSSSCFMIIASFCLSRGVFENFCLISGLLLFFVKFFFSVCWRNSPTGKWSLMAHSYVKVMYFKDYSKLHERAKLFESMHFTVGFGWLARFFTRSYKNVNMNSYFLRGSSISPQKDPNNSCLREKWLPIFWDLSRGCLWGRLFSSFMVHTFT